MESKQNMYQTILNHFCSFNFDILVASEWLLIDDTHWIGFGEHIKILQFPEIAKENRNNNPDKL